MPKNIARYLLENFIFILTKSFSFIYKNGIQIILKVHHSKVKTFDILNSPVKMIVVVELMYICMWKRIARLQLKPLGHSCSS